MNAKEARELSEKYTMDYYPEFIKIVRQNIEKQARLGKREYAHFITNEHYSLANTLMMDLTEDGFKVHIQSITGSNDIHSLNTINISW